MDGLVNMAAAPVRARVGSRFRTEPRHLRTTLVAAPDCVYKTFTRAILGHVRMWDNFAPPCGFPHHDNAT